MQSTSKTLMPIVEVPGIYADAILTDESNSLQFLSLWGRDTAIQEFRARLSLPAREGGLDNFKVDLPDDRRILVEVGDPERLESESGRTSSQTIFGALVHLWLYDRLATHADRSNRRALLLYPDGQTGPTEWQQLQERLWAQIRDTCHLPLLPHWRKAVIEAFRACGWIRKLDGVGISAYAIQLEEEKVEETLTRMVRSRQLTLQEAQAVN